MQLFVERGFEQATVAEIAERAGVTARTFFRHFADKQEVLFSGSAQLQDRLVAAVGEAPADATPIEAVAAALDLAAEHARRQPRLVAASASSSSTPTPTSASAS